MRRWVVLLLASLACACALGTPPARAPAPTPAPESAAAQEARTLSGEELARALPARADLRSEDGRTWWRAAPGVEFEVLRARERDWLELATETGPLQASWGLLAEWNPAPLADLPRLLERARSAQLRIDELALREDELAGCVLVGPDAYVLREGVLRDAGGNGLAADTRARHAASRERLERGVQALVAQLAQTPIALESRAAVTDTLAQLSLPDASGSLDFISPSMARRLVRFGWLDVLRARPELAAEIRAAVLETDRLLPIATFRADGARMELVEDGFGNRVWTLATRERVGYSRLQSLPAYYINGPPTRLVVRLPRGAYPLRDAARYDRAELWNGPERVATWDAKQGLRGPDTATWRRAFPSQGPGVEWAALSDALPRHILVTTPNADVLALVTAFGRLAPPRGGKPAEAEAFYRAAARALPDAAHLDLLGEYLLVYAYDSPDPRMPLLLGTRTVSGDVHQTAPQTLASVAGGIMRGDCDDLSELYQEIAARQGRTAHMIGLPAHAALAWAEKRGDGTWLTYLLQTGQPLGFRGQTLPDSLERTYKSFGASEVLDLTKLEVLLRFSGENTRSSWYLSWRIFEDAQYARTMIDVQRDWHFQTYQRAIEKMLRLVANGDRDASNYTELAGLYHYTAQYDLAAGALAEALARTEPGETYVSMAIDRVVSLFEAGRMDEGRALARALRDQHIPALEEQLGERLIEPRLALADALQVERGDLPFALELLADDVVPRVRADVERLAESLDAVSAAQLDTWRLRTEAERTRLRWFVASGIGLSFATADSELAPRPERALIQHAIREWIDTLGFRELDPAESVLARYSVVARFHQAVWGRASILARIERAAPPASGAIDHTERGSGDAQLERDLAFASVSPLYWSGELASLFAKEHTTLDATRAAEYARRSAEARLQARALGLDHRSFEREARETRLVAALAMRDEAALRAELREIKLDDDRRARMNAATWIATAARFSDARGFARVVSIWREEVDYKPMWFWIAWSAALAGATDQALLVAQQAAREFRDDRAFVEEYEFMRRRFAARPAGGTPTPPSANRPSPPGSAPPPGTGSR